MKIEVRRYLKRGASGDRDTSLNGVEYSDFRVILMDAPANVAPRAEWCIHVFDGYDHKDSRPLSQTGVLSAVTSYAAHAEAFFGVGAVWRTFREKPPEPRPPEWQEVPETLCGGCGKPERAHYAGAAQSGACGSFRLGDGQKR